MLIEYNLYDKRLLNFIGDAEKAAEHALRERCMQKHAHMQNSLSLLTQHSLNCFASIGDVKFSPHVSFVIGSFQYTKHSDACPILVPATIRSLFSL